MGKDRKSHGGDLPGEVAVRQVSKSPYFPFPTGGMMRQLFSLISAVLVIFVTSVKGTLKQIRLSKSIMSGYLKGMVP
jgi:hypothetical protein